MSALKFKNNLGEWQSIPMIRGKKGDKGDTGEKGNSGVYIGTEAPTDEDINVWIDTDGQPDSVTGLKYVKDDSSDNGGVIEGSVNGNNINVASGSYSHAEGFKTTASAYCSHAEGQQTVASAVFAHAEGYQTIAQSQQSHAEGMQTVAKGNMSHAEGYNNTAQGYVSHVEGQNSLASGAVSHAEGYNTTASGLDSHAEGESTIAQGNVSHAEGSGSKAIGGISHAEGSGCIANGTPSHAEGNVTTAKGNCSHSEGCHAVANGYASHVEGESTIANGQYQHVEGKYNVEDANGANGVYAHIVGGGTSNNNRVNIHTLDWNGNAVYSGKVTVGSQPTNDNDLATKKYVDDHSGSDNGCFFVNFTFTNQTYTSDKTFYEIEQAYSDGKCIVGIFDRLMSFAVEEVLVGVDLTPYFYFTFLSNNLSNYGALDRLDISRMTVSENSITWNTSVAYIELHQTT